MDGLDLEDCEPSTSTKNLPTTSRTKLENSKPSTSTKNLPTTSRTKLENSKVVVGSPRRKNSTSKKFNYLLCCLENEKHQDFLRYINSAEGIFEYTLIDKKNKKLWEENKNNEILLKEMDSVGPQKKEKNDDYKTRFNANIRKLVQSKYIEVIGSKKDSKHKCITRTTCRILRRPEPYVGESNAAGNSRKKESNKKYNKKKEIVNGSAREKNCSGSSSSNDNSEKVNSHYLCRSGKPYNNDSNVGSGSNLFGNEEGMVSVVGEHKNIDSNIGFGSNLSGNEEGMTLVIGEHENIDSNIGFSSNLSGNEEGMMTLVIGEHKNFVCAPVTSEVIEITSNLKYESSVPSNGVFNNGNGQFNNGNDQGSMITFNSEEWQKLNMSVNDKRVEPIPLEEFAYSGVLSSSESEVKEVMMSNLSYENWTYQNDDSLVPLDQIMPSYTDELSSEIYGHNPFLNSTQKQNFEKSNFVSKPKLIISTTL